jgi:hypothetical protein
MSDYLAKDFAALGLPAITEHQLSGDRQIIAFADGTKVDVSPFASDAEITAAVHEAFKVTDDNIETVAPTPTADKMPAVELAPVVQKPKDDGPKMGGVMSGGYKPGSLKALLGDLRAEGQSLMQDVAEEAQKVQKAYGHLRTARDDLKAHREGIMAELGQFSNFADDGD